MPRWPLFLFLCAPLLLAAPQESEFPDPQRSAQRMQVPEGFRVELVAGEPTLIKPIAATTDERGRLWVVESHSYPHWLKGGGPGKDRVLILEPDGKGGYRCTVFLDQGSNLSGIALGFGGVWLCSAPNLIFLPIEPGKDRPAGPPRVLLDGWSLNAKHNVFNGLTWGPDGWLYGLNGITDTSRIGKPGTPDRERIRLNCGVWRYHPTRHTFEVVAWGTTNPWGMDWNDEGELFITNCVIKHLFHVVPGAHFVRMYGEDLNPHVYSLIESCADHIHWAGGNWTTSRGGQGEHSAAGGGHAHAGALFYLGDAWPQSYRNRIFMGNIHGNRLNQDRLERAGSTYSAKHCADFLFARDSWFRPLWLHAAADGNVYVGDWHDTGECHNYDKTHPSGRIYKVSFGPSRQSAGDLGQLSDAQLVRQQLSRNEWTVRQARRLLQQRAAAGQLSADTGSALWRLFDEQKHTPTRLRALWAAYVIRAADSKRLLPLLQHADEAVRVWAIRLLVDVGEPSPQICQALTAQASNEKSPVVRLALASALRKLPLDRRFDLATPLVAHAEDAADPCLPHLIWYGIEPAVPTDVGRAVALLEQSKIPLVRRSIARRLASLVE